MLKRSTTINEQARATLSITRDEYALCSYIHYRSADSRQKVRGMCCDPKQDIAEFVGVSRRGLYKFIDRMEAKGLLSADPVTGYLSTTAKWVIVENSENKVHKDKNEECELSSQKVRTKFTKSVNKVPRNIEVKEDKYDKIESVTDLASLDPQTPTHTPVPVFSSPVEEKEKNPPSKVAAKVPPVEIPESLNRPEFLRVWEVLCQTKKWRKKAASALEMSLKKLSRFDVAFSTELVERAISGEFQGVVYDRTDEEYKRWQASKVGPLLPKQGYASGQHRIMSYGGDLSKYEEPQAF